MESAVKTESNVGEGLKSLALELENFKNIKKMLVEIGGKSFILMGGNGKGKSTVIQAMMSPLNAKLIPSEPVTIGEERAKIVHKIGGVIHGKYEEYTVELYFSDKNKKGRLKLLDKNGEEMKSPSTKIKDIIGNVSFDVTSWITAPAAEKLKKLKDLTGCGKQIDLLNIAIKEQAEKAKYKKARFEELEGALNNHEFMKDGKPDQEAIDKYSKPADTDLLQQQMNTVGENQNKYDEFKTRVDAERMKVTHAQGAIATSGSEINRIRVEIDRLNFEITRHTKAIDDQTKIVNEANDKIKKADEYMAVTPRPTMDAVNAKVSEAMAHNEKHSRINMLSDQHREMMKLKQEHDDMENHIKRLKQEKMDIISQSQLPIPGLTFTDEEIHIDGLPLEKGQQNTQKLLDISVDVAIALNPNLKVIWLHEGSFFDKANLKAVIDKIESKGYMAVIEIVDFDSKELEVIFTETALT